MTTRCFDIGLVLSGTVSAGAYTAGVIDFLIEALDAWYDDKKNNVANTPMHDVNLKVMAGTSGGALTAAIAAGSLYSKFVPYKAGTAPNGKNNRLYTSWVRSIDIQGLLRTDDLDKDQPLLSALNCKTIDQISEKITYVETSSRRPYVAESMDIYLTFTNLDGVPYNIDLGNGTHYMREHADYRHFILSEKDPYKDQIATGGQQLTDDKPVWLNPTELGGVRLKQSWEHLRSAALASSALPVGLKNREIKRTLGDYTGRLFAIPADSPCQKSNGNGGGEPGCVEYRPIEPSFENTDTNTEYMFQAVDGGMANNDPLEFARLGLTRHPEGRNIRFANLADKAVIMVSALNSKPVPVKYDNTLLSTVKAMLPTLLDHGRFKLTELKLAASKDVYSRFMVAPTERAGEDTYYKHPIYGAILNAFGAFLLDEFREHDYLLGKRNCQQFLRERFDLPESNPLCESYRQLPDNYRKLYQTNGGRPRTYQNDQGKQVSEVFYSIIPLVDSVRTPLAKPARVTSAKQKVFARSPELKDLIHQRLDIVVEHIEKEAVKLPDAFWKGLGVRGFLMALKPFAWILKNITVDSLIDQINTALTTSELDAVEARSTQPKVNVSV